MERAITRITLDVQKIDSGIQIKAKLGDSARRLVVSLTNRGAPYAPGEGVTAVYYSRKADGVKLFNSAQIDGSTVTYDFTGQTTNVEGIAECEIRLYDEEMNLLTSPRFEMLVDGTVYREGDVPDSSPEHTALTELVGQSTALREELQTAVQQSQESAGLAQSAAESAAGALKAANENALVAMQSADVAQNAAYNAEIAAKMAEAAANSGTGGLTVTDDGAGNVVITAGGTSSFLDDGAGNITFT